MEKPQTHVRQGCYWSHHFFPLAVRCWLTWHTYLQKSVCVCARDLLMTAAVRSEECPSLGESAVCSLSRASPLGLVCGRRSSRALRSRLPPQSGWGRGPEGRSVAASARNREELRLREPPWGGPPHLSQPGQRHGPEIEVEKNWGVL